MSIQLSRGFSSFQTAIGASSRPVQARSASLSPPSALRDARERNALRVEDALRRFAPRTRHAGGEHEAQAGQIARGRDVEPRRQ